VFITSTLQKHLFREMKFSDTAVKHPEVLKWNNINKRYAPTATGGGNGRKSGAAEDEGEDGAEDDGNDMGVDTPHPSISKALRRTGDLNCQRRAIR